MTTPLSIRIMLACYYASDPAEEVGGPWDSFAGSEARQRLQDNGLVNEDWSPTDRGRAWVQMICSTPLPVQRWEDPRQVKE